MAERKVFVITPIGDPGTAVRRRADELLTLVVDPVLEKYNAAHRDEPPLKAIRSDREPTPGVITVQVINQIVESPFVIVDTAGHNANVFYELGIAEAFRRPSIRFKLPDVQLPFDAAADRAIPLGSHDEHGGLSGIDVRDARHALLPQVEAVLVPNYEPQSVVVFARQSAETQARTERLAASGDPTKEALATLMAGFGELTAEFRNFRSEAGRPALRNPPPMSTDGELAIGPTFAEKQTRFATYVSAALDMFQLTRKQRYRADTWLRQHLIDYALPTAWEPGEMSRLARLVAIDALIAVDIVPASPEPEAPEYREA